VRLPANLKGTAKGAEREQVEWDRLVVRQAAEVSLEIDLEEKALPLRQLSIPS
jgi:hypothetical protein